MPHAPSYSGANYPRQQHAVTNNYITNNHHVPTTHTFIHTPSTHTIVHTPGIPNLLFIIILTIAHHLGIVY